MAQFWAEFGPEPGSEDQKCAKQEIMSETQNTPRLARHAPFAHLGTPRACKSVVLIMLMCPKPGTPSACLGEKRPENGPYRNRISATEFELELDPRRGISLYHWPRWTCMRIRARIRISPTKFSLLVCHAAHRTAAPGARHQHTHSTGFCCTMTALRR